MAKNKDMIWTARANIMRGRRHNNNCIDFDLSKGIKDNLRDILVYLCQRSDVSKIKKVGHLNGLASYFRDHEVLDYGYNTDELFRCLRVCLVDQSMHIRAGTLRTLLYMIHSEQEIVVMNKLQYGYFVARSMDIFSRGDVERMNALKLARRMLAMAPKHFSPAIARSIISITNSGLEEKDNLFWSFLGTLCELSVLNTNLFIGCGGVVTLARACTINQRARIAEATVGSLLRLLSYPETRNHVSLLCLAAPYCELDSIGLPKPSDEERAEMFAASKWAVLSVLRSFAGVMHFCHPNENSGIKAISDILYVDQLEVRGAVLELFYELLNLPMPTWTDEPDVALATVDPRRFRDTWKLDAGFVEAEGRTILSPISFSPNIVDQHMALLVNVLLDVGLHRALVETIVSSDTFISVRAAVLLGALLHLAHTLLPPEVCDVTPPLPNLLLHASTGKHQALAAVAILSRMQTMMRSRPTPASLFMDRLLQAGAWLRPSLHRDLRRHSNVRHWLKRESPMSQMLRDSQVLSSKDALAWNWSAVRSLLRSRDDSFMTLQDNDHKAFIKKLVRYFKPSSNAYSRIDLTTYAVMAREITLAGCDLINLLLEMYELEGERFLHDLIGDVAEHIMALRMATSAHDVLFSPRGVTISCCQKYFLFIGQLSHSARGIEVLRSFQLFDKLQDLAMTTKHMCYVKLVVSCLDYMREGTSRRVLGKLVNDANNLSTRLYATQFLGILLRARKRDANQWAIGMLLNRLNDAEQSVRQAALEALHEACEEPEYVEVVLQKSEEKIQKSWDQWMEHLGDRGHMLKIRLYSLRSAFPTLPPASEELERWIKPGGLTERYAGLVEIAINDSLTRRQRDTSGNYKTRSSDDEPMGIVSDVLIPPHLMGQLVQHEFGLQLLLRRGVLQRYARIVHRFKIDCLSSGLSRESGAVGSREDSRSDERKSDCPESSRLETIMDAEVGEKPAETRNTHRPETVHAEVKRKLSQDDSRRTTPEKSWKSEPEARDDGTLYGREVRIMKVKAALWALGHAGTSTLGVDQLCNLNIIELLIWVAESCPHYGVRATGLHALSLVSSCRAGADVLVAYDWACVRNKRGARCPVIQPSSSINLNQQPSPSPIHKQQHCTHHHPHHHQNQQQQQQQPLSTQPRHQRSLSDGKPELPDWSTVVRRQRIRSESAATDCEARKFILPDRGDTPSPISSAHRLSQQDADGYAKLRSLQRHRRPSYSQSSLEMYGLDGRLSLLSLSEYESPRSWNEPVLSSDPPLTSQHHHATASISSTSSQDNNVDGNERYMGICLPCKLSQIFPEITPSDVLFKKSSRTRYELRRIQDSASEVSATEDTNKLSNRLLRIDKPQLTESDSEHCSSPIPTIVFEERARASLDESKVAVSDGVIAGAGFSESSFTVSINSEVPSTSSRLVLPENGKPKQKTLLVTHDVDEESCSEYETNTASNDHTRICLVCLRERSMSNDSMTGGDVNFRYNLDKTRKAILKHTQRLANPVFYKQSRQTLLILRQQNPDIFEDECMYSEVAAHLASNTYRIQARRFLQELFLDSSFDKLHEESASILKQNARVSRNGKASLHVSNSHLAAVIIGPLAKESEASDGSPEPRSDESEREDSTTTMQSRLSTSSIVTSPKVSAASLPADQRRSDEAIIAEILRPEERLHTTKNTEKILKATGSINTAISLD